MGWDGRVTVFWDDHTYFTYYYVHSLARTLFELLRETGREMACLLADWLARSLVTWQ